MRANNIGKKLSHEYKCKIGKANSKPVNKAVYTFIHN